MAPSEFDLRAALGEGAGDGLDADRLIAAGQARRGQRRTRLLSAAAVVALVTGGAVVADQLGGGNQQTGTDSNGGLAAAGSSTLAPSGMDVFGQRSVHSAYGGPTGSAGGGAGVAGGVTAPSASTPKLATIGCPAAAPQYLLPGGGGSGSYGASGSLFRARVTSVVVCAYGLAAHEADIAARQPARLALAGTSATRLTASLEAASPHASAEPCSRGTTYEFAMIGVAGEKRIGTLTADLDSSHACASTVTNGTAVRYGWSPPRQLGRRLIALTPMGIPDTPVATPTN